MAPKAAPAKAKPAAKPKAKRSYRQHAEGSRAAPPPIVRVNTNRQRAQRGRPGRLVQCPCCAYPRYVPDGAVWSYRCAMPRVRLEGGTLFTCGFTATSAAWRRQQEASLAYETACKAVAEDVVRAVEAKCSVGEVAPHNFFPALRRAMAAGTAAHQNPEQAADIAAADVQPPDVAPAAL